MTGHQWTDWTYNAAAKRWTRRCTVGHGMCTAVNSRTRKPS